MADRRKHFSAFERLTRQGQEVVRLGVEKLDSGETTLEGILEALRLATGEEMARSSLHRFATEERLRRRLEAQEGRRDALVAELRANPDGKAARMVSLLLEEALVAKGLDFSDKDADELLAM